MRQHIARGLPVADEIVIDEIDGRRMAALRAHRVEFGGDLFRRLVARLPAIKVGDVAELAQERAAAGELQRAHQVSRQRHQIVGRDREIGERQTLFGLESHLLRRRRATGVEPRDQPVGAVAELPDMEVVELRIHLRRARHRGTTQRGDLAGGSRAARDVANLPGLDVHAADQDHVGPGNVGFGRGRNVLVNEADRPAFGHIGRDQQQSLRRHERTHVMHQPVGMGKSAERRRVNRKNAQNPARAAHRLRETQATSQPGRP